MDWTSQFPAAITVCDAQGVVVDMNDEAARVFAKDGGRALIGHSLIECHPAAAWARLQGLIETPTTNVYTIEKDGVKKLIYQAPWCENGQYRGIVELSLPIPSDVPHFVR
jgi:PAS domain-containing protein